MDEFSTMLHPEVFGDISTGLSQSLSLDDDYQSLLRMNTNDLLQIPQGGSQDLYNNILGNNGIAFVKYEEDEKPCTTMMVGAELPPSHLKKLPQHDEFFNPLLNFNVAISDKSCSASSWCYSKDQQKLFVKKKTPVTFDVTYTQPLDGSNLNLRIMLVYSNSQFAYNVISRCQDDIMKDGAKDFPFKEHVVRCLNPEACFTGRENGVNYEDRLAVLVGLNNGGAQNQQTLQTVPVSLEFLCQNSCPTMERRATTLLFTVENEHGTLLGRKSISVKICSCPKRDMVKDGKKSTDGRQSKNCNKRKNANEEVSSSDQPPRKITRQSSVDLKPSSSTNIEPSATLAHASSSAVPGPSMLGQLKRESSYTPLGYSLSNMSNSSNSAIDNDSSAVVLTLRLPDLACASEVAMYAFKHLSSILVGCKDKKDMKRYAQYLSHCKRVKKNIERSAQTEEEPDEDYDSS